MAVFLTFDSSRALAACAARSVPTYADIAEVDITRCQPTNNSYPCYYGAFEPGDGYLVAYKLNQLSGTYVVRNPRVWWKMIEALKSADFLDLRVPQGDPWVIQVDGPEDQVGVRQCNAYIAISPRNYEKNSPEYKRFIKLSSELTRIFGGLAWQIKAPGATIGDVARHLLP